MAWRLTIPAVAAEHFATTVELVLQREARALGTIGATNAAQVAADAAKAIISSWDVAADPTRTFGAVIAGHANPGGEAAEGFPNDSIRIDIWRSGTREIPVSPPTIQKQIVVAAPVVTTETAASHSIAKK